MKQEIEVIEICWDGPYKVDDVINEMYKPIDYGIYQIYGTHNVLGSDCLLYIGKAEKSSFGQRIIQHHKEWTEWEPNEVKIYLGRIGCTEPMCKDKWSEWNNQIDRAERLLIYFCSPPYNSKGLKLHGEMPPTMVLNFKRKHRLPLEVSTLVSTSQCDKPEWKIYGTEELEEQKT